MCYLVVAKWVSEVDMIVTLLNPLKIMWLSDSAFCLWKQTLAAAAAAARGM